MDSLPGTAQTRQQIAFQKFYAFWRQRRLFTLQTPWAIFDDMVIKSLKAVQGPDSDQITDFDITFKKMNFSSTDVREIESDFTPRGDIQDARNATQGAEEVNLSDVTPSDDTVQDLARFA